MTEDVGRRGHAARRATRRPPGTRHYGGRDQFPWLDRTSDDDPVLALLWARDAGGPPDAAADVDWTTASRRWSVAMLPARRARTLSSPDFEPLELLGDLATYYGYVQGRSPYVCLLYPLLHPLTGAQLRQLRTDLDDASGTRDAHAIDMWRTIDALLAPLPVPWFPPGAVCYDPVPPGGDPDRPPSTATWDRSGRRCWYMWLRPGVLAEDTRVLALVRRLRGTHLPPEGFADVSWVSADRDFAVAVLSLPEARTLAEDERFEPFGFTAVRYYAFYEGRYDYRHYLYPLGGGVDQRALRELCDGLDRLAEANQPRTSDDEPAMRRLLSTLPVPALTPSDSARFVGHHDNRTHSGTTDQWHSRAASAIEAAEIGFEKMWGRARDQLKVRTVIDDGDSYIVVFSSEDAPIRVPKVEAPE